MVKMKKTQKKLIIRYLFRQKAACLSMFIVAMLAIMAYLGINETAQAMKNNGERFWDETRFRDVEIVAPALLSEEDVATIESLEGIKTVEPVWYVTARSVLERETNFDVVSLTENVNKVILKEGRMPKTTEECLLEQPVLEELGLSVGDSFEVEDVEYLSVKRFTICGIAEHPDHACVPVNIPGNRYVIVMKEAFDLEGLQHRCMKVVLHVEGAEGDNRFSKGYQVKIAEVTNRLNLWAAQNAGHQISSDEGELSLEKLLIMVMGGDEDIRPCLVFDAWSSSHCYAIRSAAENVADIGRTFAVMFVIVGALVIFASIQRMVEEDKHRIGTAKAMGMKKTEIAEKYLCAGLIPTAAGMLIGTLASQVVIQPFLLSIYGRLYVYGKGVPVFLPRMAVSVFIVGIAIASATAILAVTGLIKKPALLLLNDQALPEKGLGRSIRKSKNERKSGHSKFKLYVRMIFRQAWREKGRLCVIVVSIAGCMVLLVTGFSIRIAVGKSVERQFSEVEQYDLKIKFEENGAGGERTVEEEIREILKNAGLQKNAAQGGWIEVINRDCVFYAEGRVNGGELIFGKPEELEGYFVMKNPESGKIMELSNTTELNIPISMAETSNLEAGDRVLFFDSAMNLRIVRVNDVFQNYVGGQMVASLDAYEKIYKEKPVGNCFLVKCEERSRNVIKEKLAGLPVTVIDIDEKKEEYLGYTTILNTVAGLLAGVAALMAGGVLVNLIYLQYYRKKGSLVVMRINGFTPAETVGYVLGESVITHIVGMVLGIIGGTWFSGRILSLMEGRQFHVIRTAQPVAWLFAAIIMLAFSVIIHAVIVRAVIRLKPTEDVMIR